MFVPVSLLIIVAVMVTLSTNIEGIASSSTTTLSSDFNFAAAGDWGCTSHTIDTVNNILDKTPELVLALGDYIYYEDEADCWLEIVEPIDSIIKIAIGNHETGAILTELMEHFDLASQYYSLDYQNVHFTVMSDYVPYEAGSEQYTFVQNDLAKAATDPNIDWIVIVHHDQEYASTKVHEIPEENKWKEEYHPLFEQYNVDLVLQAHQHNYQRTYPIKYDTDTPTSPIITDKNRSTYTNPEGQIFLTVGTAGASLHSLNGNKAPYLITAEDKVYGFLNVNVTANDAETTLVGTFYDNNAGGGEIIDQFTIIKSAESTLPILPDLPVQETDGIGEGDVVQLDNAPVSEEDENVDATAAEDVEQEGEGEEEEGDDDGGGTDEGE